MLQIEKSGQRATGLSLILIFLIYKSIQAQDINCPNGIRGVVNTASNHEAVPFAQVWIENSGFHTLTDSLGRFEFSNLAPGIKKVFVKQLGYDSISILLEPGHKKRITLHLKEKNTWLDAIDVVGKLRPFESEVVEAQSLQKTELDRSRGSSLGEMTRKIPGVSALQTGPTLFKPMIQGLTGQRIAIINNGTKQEGQQWGFDHAPEIDPNSANRITVVKGAQAVRYGADALGGVILVDQGDIDPELRKLSGRSSSGFASNSQGFFQSIMLENRFGKNHEFSWRVTGSGRKSGDYSTPKYVMGNTAMWEASSSAMLGYSHKKWKAELFASYYATQIGIFKGSHISSPEGIRQALNRPDSSYNYTYSYDIGRPYQKINHGLVKGKLSYELNEDRSLELTYSQQVDHRQEFDITRQSQSDCSTCPQLLFRLETQSLEVNYQIRKDHYEGRTGLVALTQGNVVERKILIPNFRLYQTGLYTVHSWFEGDWAYELGARAEWRQQQIFRYVGQQFQNPIHQNGIFMANAGIRKELGEHWHAKLNTQFSHRAPNVNELYSNGVHHGTASFEKGDEQLKPEKVWNSNLSLHHRSRHWQVLLNLFATYSPNFIYLTPVGDSIISTIRGPFPYYQYQASEVWMQGFDFSVEYEVNTHISVYSKGMLIRSWNYSMDNYLIFQPADRIESGIQVTKKWQESKYQFQVRFSNTLVARQYRAPENLDFAEAPVGYSLWGGRISFRKERGRFQYDLSLEGQNVFNKTYRDYMNRFRYFSYDLGQNFIVRLSIPFGLKS